MSSNASEEWQGKKRQKKKKKKKDSNKIYGRTEYPSFSFPMDLLVYVIDIN